jgi:hypothetical protein
VCARGNSKKNVCGPVRGGRGPYEGHPTQACVCCSSRGITRGGAGSVQKLDETGIPKARHDVGLSVSSWGAWMLPPARQIRFGRVVCATKLCVCVCVCVCVSVCAHACACVCVSQSAAPSCSLAARLLIMGLVCVFTRSVVNSTV